jgi:Na+/melibiose symporter-like transporter
MARGVFVSVPRPEDDVTSRIDERTAVAREQDSDDHPAPGRHRVSSTQLWFGLLGAPLAWSLQAVAAAAINSASCIMPRDQNAPEGIQAGSAAWMGILVLSVLMLALAVVAFFTAWRSWSAVHAHETGEEDELLETGEGRTRFMAMAGMLLGGIFILLIVMNFVTLFIMPQCRP